MAGRSHSGSRRWSQHERQVAAAGNVQEVHRSRSRRSAPTSAPRLTPSRSPNRSTRTRSGEPALAGGLGRSAKENEHRLPIHPDHLAASRRPRWPPGSPSSRGTARRSAATTPTSHPFVGGIASREEIFERSDVVLLPQAAARGRRTRMRHGQTLWGWPHCVQDSELTQLAIDKGLTLIAFEAMNHWTRDQAVGLHVFHKNNELAGYCSVLHALQLIGSHRRLRTPAHRGRDRLRRDGARSGDRAQRPGHPRRGRADHTRAWPPWRRPSTPCGSCTSTTIPRAVRATRSPPAAGSPWRRSSPSATSWSTARSRTPPTP